MTTLPPSILSNKSSDAVRRYYNVMFITKNRGGALHGRHPLGFLTDYIHTICGRFLYIQIMSYTSHRRQNSSSSSSLSV